MKHLRVLMYCAYFPPQYSGAALQALALAKCLRENHVHVEFLTHIQSGQPRLGQVDGFPVHRIQPDPGSKAIASFFRHFLIFLLAHRSKFDIVHSHGAYFKNSLLGPLARLVGWRSLAKATLQNNDLAGIRHPFLGPIHRGCLTMINAYVAISSDLVEEFANSSFDRSKIHFIPNGVNTGRFYPCNGNERLSLRRTLALPDHRQIFLSVGVYDQRKNIGWLINEWCKSNGFSTGALLLTVGPQSREDLSGKFLMSLKAIAEDKSNLISVRQQETAIEHYFRAADFFVLPSTSEGLPNVLLEAMASGLPSLVARVGGSTDLITDGVNGYTFLPNDAADFSHKLGMILQSDRQSFGSESRRRAIEHYSIGAVAALYIQLYHNILTLTR